MGVEPSRTASRFLSGDLCNLNRDFSDYRPPDRRAEQRGESSREPHAIEWSVPAVGLHALGRLDLVVGEEADSSSDLAWASKFPFHPRRVMGKLGPDDGQVPDCSNLAATT
jgi:hypothetical protein